MEKFAWLSDFIHRPTGTSVLATGPGFTTMEPVQGGYYSVADLAAGRVHGWLVSSTALVRVVAQGETKYVALRRSDDAKVAPGQWQAPAGRLAPEELPLSCAIRELAEEVAISGEHTSWGEALINRGGPDIDYLTQDGIHHIRARFVFDAERRTVEFYFRVQLEVSGFDAIALTDNEAYGRKVALLTVEQLRALSEAEQLTPPFKAILAAEGVL